MLLSKYSTNLKGGVVFTKPETIVTGSYELVTPKIQKGLLVLFPCFPCDAKNTKAEFDIVDKEHLLDWILNLNR